MGDSLAKNGWSVEQLDEKKFLITDTSSSNTYIIESDLIPSGIDIGGANNHFYVEVDGGWDISTLGGSGGISYIKQNLWEQPAPTYYLSSEGSEVETTGSTTDTIGPGSVTHIRDSINNEYIVNVTNDDGHALYPGLVVRIPVEKDGKFYVVSIGWGNGDNPELNEIVAGPIWSNNTEGIFGEAKAEYSLGVIDFKAREFRASVSEGVNEFFGNINDLMASAKEMISPLVLDLDGDGIELTNLNSASAVYWDIDSDGFAEASGWIGPDDGLLALDANEDGIINNHTELFGNMTGHADGFAALSYYDENHDGLIDKDDAVWDSLLVWNDVNTDGYSQSTELHTLADLDILSINLGASSVSTTIADNLITLSSSYTYDTGSGIATRTIVDAWFKYDDVNTVYNEHVEYDMGMFALPLQRGYGNLADLHIAMSLDDSGTGNLLDLVSNFSALDLDDLFTDDSTAIDAVKDILFRWAGVDGVSPTSRGAYVDAQELEFLEKLTGQPFLQAGHEPNPTARAGWEIKEAFDIALNNFFARIVMQSAGNELFEGDWYYNIASDSFEDVTGLNIDTLNDLEAIATGLANTAAREVFWDNVVRAIDYSIGVNNLSGGDEAALDDAITDSDVTLDLSDILSAAVFEGPTGNTYNGTSGVDTLSGGTGHDTLFGAAGNDNLAGGSGDDILWGEGDADTLSGETGSDVLYGGLGNDTYVYASGDGDDVIQEYGTDTGDKILFGAGIELADLTITRAGNSDLLIEIDPSAGGGRIFINGQINGGTGAGVETLQFDDTSTYNLTTQNYTLYGTAGNDVLSGTQSGGGTQDTIYGGAGDDILYTNAPNFTDSTTNWLYGEDDNDTLYGNAGADTLDGGAGNDTLSGGAGNDIYYYSSGNDVMVDSSGTDEIRLADGIVSGDISYYRQGASGLVIVIEDAGSIHIQNFYNAKIETLRFYDNSTINLSTLAAVPLFYGTNGADSLQGNASVDDTMYGYGGNDTIYGNSGNDTMYGGDGNDGMTGGTGSDYFDGGAGNDTMQDTDGGDETYVYSGGLDSIYDWTGNDVLRFTNSATTVNDLGFTDLGTHHKITINASVDEITLQYVDSNAVYLIETGEFVDGFSVNLSTWKTWINGTSSGETLNGTSGADTIIAKDGADTLNGDAGSDEMHGGSGDDILDGGAGDDLIHGGVGTDTVSYANASGAVTVDLSTGTATGDGSDTLISIESIIGSAYADALTGDANTNTLNGGAGNDSLSGGDGDDALIGGAGDDTLTGGVGTDTIDYSASTSGIVVNLLSNSWLYDGVNSINGLTAYDGLGGTDILSGIERVIGTDETDYIWGTNQAGNNIYGGGGNDTIYGGQYTDQIFGGDGNDNITAQGDNDYVDGEAGDDVISGSGGDDEIHGGDGTDNLNGKEGSDTIYGDAGNDIVNGDEGADILYGGDGNDTVHGNDDADTIYGGVGNDLLFGDAGDDTLYGDDGNDALFGGAGSDAMYGGAGTDELNYAYSASGVTASLASGTASNDGNGSSDTFSGFENLTGGAYADTLTGDDGANRLKGNAGNDILTGGEGVDTLYGNGGSDIFVWLAGDIGTGVDAVQDFNISTDGDKLDLSDMLTGYDPLTDIITDFVQITTSGANSIVSVDVDGGANGFVQIATLLGITGLTDEAALVTSGNLIAA